MSVELGFTSDRRWHVETGELVTAVKDAGFTSLGMGAEAIEADTAHELRSAGLHCHEVMALIVSDNQEATLAYAERVAVKAGAIGAKWVVTVFTATLNDQAVSLVKRCASILADSGARMAVEFSPLGSVTSITEGLRIVEQVGPVRAGVLVDTWHFFHGPSSWDDLVQIPLERIAYVQFSDALEPVSDDQMNETMNRRAMPGRGTLDLERFAATLRQRQWDGLVSVEVLSRENGAVSIREFARTAHKLTAKYWL